jgi:hypothetical protein
LTQQALASVLPARVRAAGLARPRWTVLGLTDDVAVGVDGEDGVDPLQKRVACDRVTTIDVNPWGRTRVGALSHPVAAVEPASPELAGAVTARTPSPRANTTSARRIGLAPLVSILTEALSRTRCRCSRS